MRKKSDKPGDPVKKTVATTGGNLPADQFPEISEEQQQIIPPFAAMEKESNPAIYDIAPSATVEEVTALFFDEMALKVSDEKLYRLDRAGHRYYYTFNDVGEPQFFPSITTLIGQTMPKDERLIKWIADIGYIQAEEYKVERGHYGTFMHGQYADLMITGEYDLNRLRDKLNFFIESECLPGTFVNHADMLRKNMLSLAQWMLDYEFEPLAIEMPIVNYRDGYALTLDVAGYIREPGKRDKELVIVDFKSGKAFHEENEIQLFGQRDTWNLKFPNLPIKRLFNFRPKDWRNKPTYEFKEQTDSPNGAKLPHLLALAQIEDKKLDNTLIICDGVISLGAKNITDVYKVYSLSELVKKSKAEKTPGEQTAVTVEDIKAEPEATPEPTVKKTPIVKRAAKKPKEAEKKAATSKKTTKRGNTTKKETKPANEPKKPKNESRKKMLNDDPEI